MVFSSLTFIIFIVVFFLCYRCLNQRLRLYFLLASSYFFYGWWDWRYLTLIFASTLVDYFVALKLQEEKQEKSRRFLLVASIVVNLGILFAFKYFNFFARSFHFLLETIGFQAHPAVLKVLLPVGISFYTFQSMGYTIDVFRKKSDCEKSFVSFATYVAFFPQLVAGPIERASALLPQIKELNGPSAKQIREGVSLVLWGYFLKVFIADNISRVVDAYFIVGREKIKFLFMDPNMVLPLGDPKLIPLLDKLNLHLTSPEVFIGVLAFGLQIYGDFAGYSKIARGISKFFGIELMRNFNHPYFAKNPSDFWRRWHISLSTWLRDYLYIPLGGNKKGSLLTYRNLILTMLLGGLWHGASWVFVVWGLYQGLLLCVHRLSRGFLNKCLKDNIVVRVFSVMLMFISCQLGWLIFRSQNFGQLQYFSWRLFSDFKLPTGNELVLLKINAFWVMLFYGIIFISGFIQEKHKRECFLKFTNIQDYVLAAVMVFCIVFLGGRSEAFIYFQF